MKCFTFRISLGDGAPFEQEIVAVDGSTADLLLRQQFPTARQLILLKGRPVLTPFESSGGKREAKPRRTPALGATWGDPPSSSPRASGARQSMPA